MKASMMCLGWVCLSALGAAPVFAMPAGRVLHVSAAASGSGDGTTWKTAFTDLNVALSAAVSGDQIWVAAGTYTPAASDRTATFVLMNGVALFGGFAGDEVLLDQRNWMQHRTVLSGDLAGDDGPEFENTGENSYHILTARSVDATATLNGFTVTGGRADGPGVGSVPESFDQGSALNVYSATPHIENVVFAHNWSIGHAAVNDNGGATFVECEFRENHSVDFAGALFIAAAASTNVSSCQFVDNTTTGKGGGIYCQSTDGTQITHCFFYGNAATAGGGIFDSEGSRPSIRGCSFRANTAFIGGGGIYDDIASPRVSGCAFLGNAAGVDVKAGGGGAGGSGGGGLWNSGGEALILDCQFRNNAASFGGGIYNNNSSTAVIRNCEFDHNSAHEAGGVYNLTSNVIVQHCAFLHNNASAGDFSVGGGISNYYSDTRIDNCSFRANHAELGGGGVYNEGENPTLSGCVFAQNFTDGTDEGWGGGVFNGYFCTPILFDCTFTGNVAHRGGAIFDIIYSSATIVNCTLSSNVANDGGALHDFEGSDTHLTNSIVWGNSPGQLSGTPIRASYCCIEGGYPGVVIISADPLFALSPTPGPDGVWGTTDDQCGDLRLEAGSPCIDAGDNSAVPADHPLDLAGNPRFLDDPDTVDTGLGDAPIVDLGAFEF